MTFDPSSRVRLKPHSAVHFPGNTLFDRLGRVVCEAHCLRRKELYESWECCHHEDTCERGGLDGWVDLAVAIDVTRAHRLQALGYDVSTHLIPATITPKNRLLLGEARR